MTDTILPVSRRILLSKSVQPRDDGEYSFDQKALLVPHETLRREMMYGLKALKYLDLPNAPWKAHCFNEWLSKFLAPAVHGHHDLEGNIFISIILVLNFLFYR
jgi:hypothetical protein